MGRKICIYTVGLVLLLTTKCFSATRTDKVVGGTGTTSDLSLQTTSGVGATGADMHFLVGNNGATEAMTILNSGSVGLGVINPDTTLEVNGNIKLSSAALNCIYFENTNNYLYFEGWQSETLTSFYFKLINDADMEFYTNNSLRLTIDNSGNVGIGATAPASVFGVINDSIGVTVANTQGVSIVNTTDATSGNQQYSPPLRLRGEGFRVIGSASQPVDYRMYVVPVQGANVSGNLYIDASINEAAYTNLLKLSSTGALTLTSGGTFGSTVTASGYGFTGQTSAVALQQVGNTDTVIYPYATGGDIILSSTNVGIGTSSPTHMLTIANGATSAGVIAINEDTDNGTNNATLTVPALAADTDYVLPPDDGDAGEQLQTDGAGNLTWETPGGVGSTAYDDIGDPDAASTIAFDDTETVTYQTAQDTAGSFFVIDNTDTDVGNNVYLLELQHSDDGDTDADFLKCVDNNTDVKLTVQENGNLATVGTVEGATITEGGVGVPNTNDNLSVFAATTSAQLAGVISDETGTGVVVLATSPTLVTPVLGTITSGVGTALTALNGENIQDDTIDEDSIDWGTGAGQISATDMDDFGTMTATAGNHLIADGTDFESVANIYKVVTFSRDTATATGTQAVTGVGFKPKVIIVLCNQNSVSEMSIGFDDATTPRALYDLNNTTADSWGATGAVVYDLHSTGNSYSGVISSFDSDGFTISWTRSGTPTGEIVLSVLALR